MLGNAATVRPVMAASAPPVTIASATPVADQVERLADRVGRRGAGRHGGEVRALEADSGWRPGPAAMSGMNIGTKNGETRSGPLVMYAVQLSS